MAENIRIIGAGGFGREALDVIEAINASPPGVEWKVQGVIDDAPTDLQLERLATRGYRYLGTVDENRGNVRDGYFAIGVGSPSARQRIAELLQNWGAQFASVVHPKAVIGSELSLGNGAVVCAGVQISTNVRLGRHVHLNPGGIIGHDAHLGDHVSINPGAVISGEVTIGEGTLIGAAAVVLQRLTVGAGVTVGASACVTRDVPEGATVKGVPAR